MTEVIATGMISTSGQLVVDPTARIQNVVYLGDNISGLNNNAGYITASPLSGYVTSASLATTLGGYATTSALTTGLSGKQNTITTGTGTQYFKGDLSLGTFQTDVRTAISVTGNGSYNSSTGVITINSSSLSPTVNNNVARSLNSNFTIASNVRGAICNYSINASWTIQALLSGSGSAFLEYSIDSGSNWVTVNQVGKSLNLLTFAGSDDMNLSGFIPSTATTTRIRTTSTNMTITYTRGQEVLL